MSLPILTTLKKHNRNSIFIIVYHFIKMIYYHLIKRNMNASSLVVVTINILV